MTIKVLCKLADCVNWDSGLCGADEIRIDREGYCVTYEEIPEETEDLDLEGRSDDMNWEDEDEEDLGVDELGEEEWDSKEEEDDEEDDDSEDEDDPWSD